MWMLLALLFLAGSPAFADETAGDAQRTQRLKSLQEKFSAWNLSLHNTAEPLTFEHDELPLLRYTNPVGGMVKDGGLFVWRAGRRPVAACSFTIRGPTDPPSLYVEMTSLTATPLHCERSGKPRWTPQSAGLADRDFPEAEPPGDKPISRLVAMRNLARRFTAEEFSKEQQRYGELRLLPQPIDRFDDLDRGVVDGALFAFVEANDPQVLLLIEARRQSRGDVRWRYTIARMSSRQQRVLLDGREVLFAANFWQGSRSPDEPYLEMRDGPMILNPSGTKSPE